MTCHCGKGESLETCCGPFLSGKSQPKTAEELMRSRYSAFVESNIDYIFETHDPTTAGELDRKATEAWAKESEWLDFEMLNSTQGEAGDDVGMIEFVARYKIRGKRLEHRERAQFRKHEGRWVFVDGEELTGPPIVREAPKVGRNDPCVCGSGKKFKKCCGRAA